MDICFSDIVFSHGDRPLFSGLSLCLESCLFHGILGPNGSGKTTLLDLLAGYRRPGRGRVLVGGRDIATLSRRETAKALALVPQDFRVNFPFTVRQVVMMGRYPHLGRLAGPSRMDMDLVDEAMAATGIRSLAGRKVTELSGGERQRVVVARALAQDAEVLVLDEATANLDVRHTLDILNLARDRVASRGLTVVAAMHDLNLAARYCHTLVFLKEGRMAAQGPVDRVLTGEVVEAVFGVRTLVREGVGFQGRQVVFL